jgi:hypothetical protein
VPFLVVQVSVADTAVQWKGRIVMNAGDKLELRTFDAASIWNCVASGYQLA